MPDSPAPPQPSPGSQTTPEPQASPENFERPLLPWMKGVLRFAAGFNLCAGVHMAFLYHETYKLIGMPKPEIHFPIQLVGILVALFGYGYYLVARHPLRNRDLLLVGWWSKYLGSCLGIGYILMGKLPLRFFLVFFFADIIYLPLFAIIHYRLKRVASLRESGGRRSEV